ncbi:hypothetical protein CDAR_220481 [Caerostris darwini]|uniref:Uncharacterized protein n=1 Tax=Caerostris darwini TaxID=1538125 RepID=A0AAV4UFM3_9ARAC|nr:hypothetical protein CDAR_220481 [Caerostris darwini]
MANRSSLVYHEYTVRTNASIFMQIISTGFGLTSINWFWINQYQLILDQPVSTGLGSTNINWSWINQNQLVLDQPESTGFGSTRINWFWITRINWFWINQSAYWFKLVCILILEGILAH